MREPGTVPLLVFGPYNADSLDQLKASFDVIQTERRDIALVSEADRSRIQAVALAGHLSNEAMDLLPKLEIVGHFGVGYDGVDAAHAGSRGIAVTNTPDVLTEEVADTALALLLMTVRELPQAERHARSGDWERSGPYPLTPLSLRGRRLGIMGLGRIGLAIAKRAESFGLAISYHNRSQRTDVPYEYHASLVELARGVDILLVVAPGGAGTERAVDAAVFEALGPKGVFVNVGRGSTVDEPALIEALERGTIAAAGLDVFADEPRIPERLRALPNTVLLPHVASASHDTRIAMGSLVTDNLRRWFAGEPLASPVPESAAAGLIRRP